MVRNAETLSWMEQVARVRSDPHSPNQYRVDGTLSNVPEFARAFNCPAGSKVHSLASPSTVDADQMPAYFSQLNPPREKQCLFW